MIDAVAAAARELGLIGPAPADHQWWIRVELIHDRAREDLPVYAEYRRRLISELVNETGCDPAHVVTIDFTGPYLAAAVERLTVNLAANGIERAHPPTAGAILGIVLTAK